MHIDYRNEFPDQQSLDIRFAILADQVAAIIAQLAELGMQFTQRKAGIDEAELRPELETAHGRPQPKHGYVKVAERLYAERLKRSRHIDTKLLGEPAWNILLDLYIANGKGQALSVTSVTIGSGVPSTTALRWITVLETEGLITRHPDLNDGRRYLLTLARKGVEIMDKYFQEITRA
ncbi:MAG: MarR family transcriptional regulator [Novosphingobium sp.]|nr:MarR family transcriptional regulator [Novosphingobium sp.]